MRESGRLPILALIPVAVIALGVASLFAFQVQSGTAPSLPPETDLAPEPVPAQPELMRTTLDACLTAEAFAPALQQERQRYMSALGLETCGSLCEFHAAGVTARQCAAKSAEHCGEPVDRACLEAFAELVLERANRERTGLSLPVAGDGAALSPGFYEARSVLVDAETAASLVPGLISDRAQCFGIPIDGHAHPNWCGADRVTRYLFNSYAARHLIETFRDGSLAPIPDGQRP